MGATESTTLYVSFNLKTVGGNPEDLPVINWGFVAYTGDKEKVSDLSVNTIPLRADPNTIAWFNSTDALKEKYAKCIENAVPPEQGIKIIRAWLVPLDKEFKGNVILIAYPTVFDGSLLYYYWFRYLGHPTGGKGPGFTILDIRSYASGKLNIPYTEASWETALKPYVPTDTPHTHCGLNNAEAQMWLYFNIRDGNAKP